MASANWPPHIDPSHLYYITTSAVQHRPVFQRDVIKRILIDSLNTGRILQQYALFAFVIMPNHLHFIVRCLNDYTPEDIIREFKKSTSNLIIRHLQAEHHDKALSFFAAMVKPDQNQKHRLWENEYQAKNIFSPTFLRQKLAYIHNNPLQPHWRLTQKPEDYIWSSARFYLQDEPALIPLSDARELLI